ncbi:MAG: iron-containing alcohol dehydrogenase, partial [Aedoeadaptatus pacaensis]
MDKFIFSVPTTIFFGEGQVRAFADAVKSYGDKALIVFGGGSVKRNGIYDEITGALGAAGVETVDHGGIEPNP